MLDQPVPNPLAKNPNIYTHKVFAAVGLILTGTILAVAGIWWLLYGQDPGSFLTNDIETQVSTSSAQTPPKIPEFQLIEDIFSWNTFKNTKFNYSLNYPEVVKAYDASVYPDLPDGTPTPTINSSSDLVLTNYYFLPNAKPGQGLIPGELEIFDIIAIEKKLTTYKDKTFDELVNNDYNSNKKSVSSFEAKDFAITELKKTILFGREVYTYSLFNSKGYSGSLYGFTLQAKVLDVISFEKDDTAFTIIFKPSSISETMLSTLKFQ